MAGRLGHINDARRVGHVPVNGIRKTIYRYGFGGAYIDFDARFGTNTVTEGAGVTNWTDQISGISTSQGTEARRPLYDVTNPLFNGYPCLNFNTAGGVLDRLELDTPIGFYNDFTLAVVYYINTVGSVGNILFATSEASVGALVFVARTLVGSGVSDGTNSLSDPNTPDTAPHISIITPRHIIVDGSSVVTGSTTIYTPTAKWIGTSGTNAGLNANVTRILIYNSLLSESQCILLSNHINSEYAIY